MKEFVCCLFQALTLSLLSGWLSAADWPQFRGPNRDGCSTEKGLASQWGDAGPRQLWRQEVGAGFSGITIVKNRVYTMDSDDTDEYALCLDAQTGKRLWRKRIASLFTNKFGDGPRSTPTVADGIVYVLASVGVLKALSTDKGETLWEVNFVESFASQIPIWAFSSSPLIVGDNLIVEVGGSETAIAAFNKKTGKLTWSGGEGQIVYSSPLSLTFEGTRQILHITKAELVSLDLQGNKLWSTPFKPKLGITPAIPVFVEPDLIFLSASYDAGSKVARLKKGGVEEVWDNRTSMRNHFNSSIAVGSHLYGFDKAIFKSIEAETGEIRWMKRGFGKGSLIYADGMFIVLSERGKLVLFKADHTEPKQLADHQVLSGRCWTQPSLSDRRVYVRNHTELVSLDLRSVK